MHACTKTRYCQTAKPMLDRVDSPVEGCRGAHDGTPYPYFLLKITDCGRRVFPLGHMRVSCVRPHVRTPDYGQPRKGVADQASEASRQRILLRAMRSLHRLSEGWGDSCCPVMSSTLCRQGGQTGRLFTTATISAGAGDESSSDDGRGEHRNQNSLNSCRPAEGAPSLTHIHA